MSAGEKRPYRTGAKHSNVHAYTAEGAQTWPGREHDSRSVQRHRQPHLEYRRRCAARPLRTGQVPRRDSADDRAPAVRRRSGAHQAGCPRRQDIPRSSRDCQPGLRIAPGRRASFLQHVSLHPARSPLSLQSAAATGRLRGLPRRLLAQRAGDPRQTSSFATRFPGCPRRTPSAR